MSGNTLAQRTSEMRGMIAHPAVQEQIQHALARVGWTPERFTRMVFTCLSKTPKLADCTQGSFLGAVIQAAEAGLSPSAYGGECYIIPYGKDATFVPGYRGMMKLAWRSDRVVELHADVVREGDHFVQRRGKDSDLEHTPGDADELDDGNITHAYAYARLQGGGFQFAVMTRKQVDSIRAKSQSGRSRNSPWASHFPEMAKKTAIRRLMKMLPLSTDDMRVVDLAGAEEAGVSQDIAVAIPADVRNAPPVESTDTLEPPAGEGDLFEGRPDTKPF